MPFPLLRCPYLVGAEILKNMPHQELFLLSLSCKRAKKAIKMFLPKGYLSAQLQTKGYGTVMTQHGTEKRHFRLRGSCSGPSGITYLIGNTYAEVHSRNLLLLTDIDFKRDAKVALKSFISHINICWNSPRISIKMDKLGSFYYFSDLMKHLKLNAMIVDSVEFTKYVCWEFREHFLQCKSVKLYFLLSYYNVFEVRLINFLKKLVKYSENKLEVITILDCEITFEEIINGLNKKGVAHEVAGSNLELQRCDGKKVLISLVDQVLEVKVV